MNFSWCIVVGVKIWWSRNFTKKCKNVNINIEYDFQLISLCFLPWTYFFPHICMHIAFSFQFASSRFFFFDSANICTATSIFLFCLCGLVSIWRWVFFSLECLSLSKNCTINIFKLLRNHTNKNCKNISQSCGSTLKKILHSNNLNSRFMFQGHKTWKLISVRFLFLILKPYQVFFCNEIKKLWYAMPNIF